MIAILTAAEAADGIVALQLPNDVDATTVALDGVERIELHFPKFNDGRAYSQARLLRRRGFTGDLRATGDVLVDQLVHMHRQGFSSAVLKDGKDPADARRQLDRFAAFEQGDTRERAPVFARG